ncbi:unnamed protein product [Coregonus sp. 'balchen']|nr:unnamed protein product [Coregonus sp. 'balchen']
MRNNLVLRAMGVPQSRRAAFAKLHERVSRLDSSGAYDREAYDARRENRMAARKKAEEEAGCTDYKKAT